MISAENLPLVSVICNCFNHQDYIEEALCSVMQQSYTNIELIVLNNGSTDDSRQIISSFAEKNPSVTFIDLPETQSHTIAFNIGFRASSGEFLIDLSGDDRLLPDGIQKQINFFLKQEDNVGLLFGNAKKIDEKGRFFSDYFAVDENRHVLDKTLFNTDYSKILAGGLCMCSVSAIMKRHHFELLNGYNEALFFEDLDYWLRLSYHYKIAFLDDFLVEKRELQHSLGNWFYQKGNDAKKINDSTVRIIREALERNNGQENRCLLKRIHTGIVQSFKHKNFSGIYQFLLLEIQCRARIYFR